MSTLAKRFGFSDVAVAKACKRAGIPIPDRGYWAKRAAGKRVDQPDLPPRALGQHDEIEFGGSRYGSGSAELSDAEVLAGPLPPRPQFEDDYASVATRARAAVGKITIPKNFLSPHPEIAKLLAADEKRREKQRQYSYTWDAPLFDSTVERRRLRFLNGLFLGLACCGCKVSIRGREARDITVTIGDQHVAFRLDEKGAKDVHPGGNVPAIKEGAKLTIALQWWQPPPEIRPLWTDTDERSLEDLIEEFATELLIAAEWGYRRWKLGQHDYLLERREELLEQARQRKAKEEREAREKLERLAREKRDRLIADATAWRRAAEIRDFVAALKSADRSLDPGWIAWALHEADAMDPLVRKAALSADENQT